MDSYKKDARFDWEGMIAKGENPNGFTAQGPNGTQHATGTGWNRQWGWNNAWKDEQRAPKGPWPSGRSNRTGE